MEKRILQLESDNQKLMERIALLEKSVERSIQGIQQSMEYCYHELRAEIKGKSRF